MNPYAYQQAQLQQHQQQYQYQGHFNQTQQYYYVQSSATVQQGYQTPATQQPYSNAQYGTIGYQGVGAVPHYQVQGYSQVAGTQQYAVAGQNYYTPTTQTNTLQSVGQTHQAPPTALKEAPPPLPPEQSISAAPPPLPPNPAPTFPSTGLSGFSGASGEGQSAAQNILEAHKKYEEKYAQWQRDYAQWQAQHQHHPDQKQFQEWQIKMQHWQEQNKNVVQQQAVTAGINVPPQNQGQVAGLPQHQASQQQQQQQHQAIQQQQQHQAIQQQHQQQQQQHQQIVHQYQEQQLQQQMQSYEQRSYLQHHAQSKPQWLQNTFPQNQHGNYHQSHVQKLEEQWQSQFDQQQNSNQVQGGPDDQSKSVTSSQSSQLPRWMQSSKVTTSNSQGWMQSASLNTTAGQQDMAVVTNKETKKVPQWLQKGAANLQHAAQQQHTPDQQHAMQQQQEDSDTPRWLREKLEKTERDMKQAAEEKAQREKEAEKKHLPNWMQNKVVANEEVQNFQQNHQQQRQIPKWLQGKPTTAGNQAVNQKNVNQLPKWLQNQASSAPDSIVQTAPATTSTNNPSKWNQDEKTPSSVSSTVSKKLDPMKEILLLKQQQEQLQKLEQLEKRLKQSGSSSSTASTVAMSSSFSTSQIDTTASSSWAQHQANKQNAPAQQTNKAQMAGQANISSQQKATKPTCKFFPNCRFGQSSNFQHPPCKLSPRCNKQDCVFDHTTDSAVEDYTEDIHDQYPDMASFTGDQESYSGHISQFSSRVDQIPGIADGEMPVVPAQTDSNYTMTGDTSFKPVGGNSRNVHDNQTSQEDCMPIEEDKKKVEKAFGVSGKSEDNTQPDVAQDSKPSEDWQQTAQHEWGHGDDWRQASHHHDERPSEEGTWGRPPHKQGFSKWDTAEINPADRDLRPPLPIEEDSRRDWRSNDWDTRPPFPRDDREFGPGRFERDRRPPFEDPLGRRPPFPPDDPERRLPWWDEADRRHPLPAGDDREHEPFRRDRPRAEWDRDRSPFPREFRDGRQSPPRDLGVPPLGPPVMMGETAELQSKEKGAEEQANNEMRGEKPFPRDDRPPFPADGRDRPPFLRDERDRPPFPGDERDRPPFFRDDRDRPPFLRDDWGGPPFPREEWDRPPFPREDHDFPFPPRRERDRWPSPPRDERDRWVPFPRDDRDLPEWERRRGGPPGRPMSPRGRERRGRPPFYDDDRGRHRSPPPWPPIDPPRRPWSPPGRDFRGRPPPPPEEFDRFGRPLPPRDAEFFDDRVRPPWDWDRDERRRPPRDDDRPREPRYPDDRRPRSPPPHWDHPDRLPPRYSSDWEMGDRRGPDDRWRDERGPLDRRPPHDDFLRDRPPYPDDPYLRDPASYPSHPEDIGHSSEPVRVEKKPETLPVESILDSPGRESRPDRIVIILRGPPGSGKTHVARLIKDKEVSHGAHAPRILALDDYFLMEVEKSEKDPETGRKVKKKVTEYVYEEEMEDAYRTSLFKSFTKTLEDGFFPVVIVDAIHDKVEHFEKYWSHAKQKGFEVYVAELMADAHACAKRNSHNRTFEDINKMVAAWEETPVHHLRLDVRSLLQDAVITEVEMDTADETDGSGGATMQEQQPTEDDEEEHKIQVPSRSKWDDMEPAEDKLNKLDGIRPMKSKRRREESPPAALSDEDDPYDEREEDMRIGKKRVRWADLEEKKDLEHRRRIGFCIGTDWSLLTDPHAEIPRM